MSIDVQNVFAAVNELTECCGVESVPLGSAEGWDSPSEAPAYVYYLNTGDMYDDTLCYTDMSGFFIASPAELVEKYQPQRELLLSDTHGINIPYEAITGLPHWNWSMVDAEDKQALLDGPDHEWYWEAWESALNYVTYTDSEGKEWHLEQDGDLWAVHTPEIDI